MVYTAQVKPFLSNLMDKMETYNEFSIVLMIDIYATLLGFKFNKREILSFGYLLNLLIILMLGANFFVILFETVYENKTKIKVFFFKYKRKILCQKKRNKDRKAEVISASEEFTPSESDRSGAQLIDTNRP